MTPRYFLVVMKFQYPAWDQKDGLRFWTWAKSKSDANKHARKQASDAGHLRGVHGRVVFKATEAR